MSGPTGEPPLFIRLYLDEDIHRAAAAALRLRRFDASSAHEEGRWGLTDAGQLAHAASEGRALVTFNTVDFLALHRAWLEAGRTHWGIIVSEQVAPGELVRRLLRLLNRVAADEMRDQLYWLSRVGGGRLKG